MVGDFSIFIFIIIVDSLPTFPGLIDGSPGFVHPVPPFTVVFNHLYLIDRNNDLTLIKYRRMVKEN